MSLWSRQARATGAKARCGEWRAFAGGLGIWAASLVGAEAQGTAGETLAVALHYVERRVERPPTLSGLARPPEDEGLIGARLGFQDNQTTGRYLGHAYALRETIVEVGDDFLARAREALAGEPAAIVVNAPAEDTSALARLPEAQGRLVINAGAVDDRLRGDACSRNMLHTVPSRAMLADALMQYVARRRWSKIFLLIGPRAEDALFADAVRLSARKFGARIVAEKAFDTAGADLRRSASAEMPLLTQGPDYDFVVVADEARDFAAYVPYNTWLPRPVGGSAGLEASIWHGAIEQWGALQLQSRFGKLAGRTMTGRDWSAWAAMRAVAEAVTRTRSNRPDELIAFLRSDKFELAGFKGRSLSFRSWDGQMRQPIHLTHPSAVVAVAPLEGFLHRRNELDTLGLDEPESRCNARS